MPSTVLHVTGARPNFPKAAPVIDALAQAGVQQLLVHTGQHYDTQMSDVFFNELGLPKPDVNLGIGSGTHALQTARIMEELESMFLADPPAMVVVYGDVNSTVAASLVAAKLRIPIAHVEAGLRSFDLAMPEEINRMVTDRLSTVLFATSPEAVAHLACEGVDPQAIHLVGNPMIDTLLKHRSKFDATTLRSALELPDNYAVATIHRPSNVDDPEDTLQLVKALHAAADQLPLVIPLHPRGRSRLHEAGLLDHPKIHVVEPMGYLDFMSLVTESSLVITDSGGVQEETTILGVPCLTLRSNTERPATITHGTNRLVTRESLAEDVRQTLAIPAGREHPVPPLWDGASGPRIAKEILNYLHTSGADR